MKIKRVAHLYMFCIALIVTPHCSYAGDTLFNKLKACFNCVKPDPMLHKAVVTFNEGTAANLDKAHTILELFTVRSKEIVDNGGILLTQASGQFGILSAKELAVVGQQFNKILAVGTAIYGVTQLYPIAQDVKSYWFPTMNQQLKEAMAMQRLQMIKAETSFRNCLIDNRFGARGRSGIPTVCERAAEMFATLGQREEVEQSIAYFNKCRDRD